MAYWREWRSLLGGGIGFVILGIIMMFFSMMENAEGAAGPGGLGFEMIGIIFIILGVLMTIGGYLLKGPSGDQKNA